MIVVPEAVLDDTNRFRSSLCPERSDDDGYRGICAGRSSVDDVTLMVGMGAGVTARASDCHGASRDMLDMS